MQHSCRLAHAAACLHVKLCLSQVIVIDEIGSSADAAAVRGIAQRGVVVVGTAHGTHLSGLMANIELNSLIGGIHLVALSDAEAE